MQLRDLFRDIGWTFDFSWTGYVNPMKITVTRTRKTADGIFGNLFIDQSLFKCFSWRRESLPKAINPGTYAMKIDFQPEV